jgi:trigger factor
LDIQLEKKSTTQALLTFQINADDYQNRVNDKIKEYSKKIQLKGFRPGKVPANLINKMYGKSILADEINELISENLEKYITENNLPVVGSPKAVQEEENTYTWKVGENFKFAFELALHGDFSFNLGAISLTKYTVEVQDSDVEKEFSRRIKQVAEVEEVEISTNFSILSGELTKGDFNIKTLIQPDTLKDDAKSKFIGVKVGDIITFDLATTFYEKEIPYLLNVPKNELDAYYGEYQFKIMTIKDRNVNNVTIEQYNKSAKTQFESFDALKQDIKQQIEKGYLFETDFLLSQQFVKAVVKQTEIELPTNYIKELLKNDKKTAELSEEEFEKKFQEQLEGLKWVLIKNKIVEDQKLQNTEQEVIDYAKQKTLAMFLQFGMSNPDESLLQKITIESLTRDNGKGFTENYNKLLDEKVFDYAKTIIQLVEETITTDKFTDIVEKFEQEY